MKIYILRHEDRTQDCSFFAPLTKQGLDNSVKLIDKLKKHNINLVFSSPFIRTLQTIYPYVKEKGMKINLEYGLSELHHTDLIPPKAVGISLPEYLAELFNSNPEYKTVIKPTDIPYPENNSNVTGRVKEFLRTLFVEYSKTDYNIVIVTHQSVCNSILGLVNKHSNRFKGKLSEKILNNFEKGKLCLIFDNDWTYEPC